MLVPRSGAHGGAARGVISARSSSPSKSSLGPHREVRLAEALARQTSNASPQSALRPLRGTGSRPTHFNEVVTLAYRGCGKTVSVALELYETNVVGGRHTMALAVSGSSRMELSRAHVFTQSVELTDLVRDRMKRPVTEVSLTRGRGGLPIPGGGDLEIYRSRVPAGRVLISARFDTTGPPNARKEPMVLVGSACLD